MKKTYYVVLFFFFSLLSVNAQIKADLEVSGFVRSTDAKALEFATISLEQDSTITKQILSNRNGQFSFEIKPNTELTVSFSKEGFLTKKLFISTNNIPKSEEKKKGNYGFLGFAVELFRIPNDTSIASQLNIILSKPVAKINFDTIKKQFDFNRKYYSDIKLDLAKVKELQESLEKIEANPIYIQAKTLIGQLKEDNNSKTIQIIDLNKDKDIRDLEIKNSKLENEKKASELILIAKEKELQKNELLRQMLLSDKKSQELNFLSQSNDLQKAKLNAQLSQIENQKLETEKKEKEVSLLNKDKQLKEIEIERQKEISKTQFMELKTQKTILYLLFGILLIVVLFAGVFFTQRNKIKKGKQLSDELLLNILPSEVAEELKAKGSADAKQFDDVTVMFTDFKGFTQISEKLTPAELVAEIHTCFKAFDAIITKHNIEKIKTIGDAYMCAGGLPMSNTTHASDVVKAAIEIQHFMMNHLQERKASGKELFEIRIGIHTGPVVAGIVGVKKFAYDIWGDTVNIASRMESSGEAGKVNISGSTYELVKDIFTCIHRGKIQAKNKGEVDMYFVDNVLELHKIKNSIST